jgi:pimeloyl-ACP methyl ester carboxylesterase
MKACHFFFWIMTFAMCGVGGASAQDKASGPLEQAARTFVERLDKGEFATAAAEFDATMKKKMPPDELKKTWQKVLADAGAFKKPLTTRLQKKGEYEIVIVTSEFAKGKWDTRVVFDKEAKITGLFFARAAPTGTAETYEGKLNLGAAELRLVFHLFKQKDGSYQATMDSPDQGAKGIVLDAVSLKDNQVRMEFTAGKFVYEGKRSEDGKEITGTFKQAGQSFPLNLKRVAKATESRRPQTPRPPFPYDAVEVTYENAKASVKLAGTLTLPRGTGPFPVALLITGSGPQDRDETLFGHKPFLVLADYLTRRGIAVLRVDDRGVGDSTGKVSDATTADFAEDVEAGIAFLKSRKEIDPARIGLIGHSEGGIIGPLVASRSKDVAFIVMLAGTGLPGEDVLYAQGAAVLKAVGADAAALARQKKLQERMFAVLRQEKDPAVAEKKLRAAIAEVASSLGKGEKEQAEATLPMLEGQIKMALTPWFRHFLSYDPRPALRKVTCPVLALNGTKDVQVDAPANLPAIEAALKQGGNKDVTTIELPNLNHLFQTCKTGAISEYGAIEETIAPAVLEAIGEWLDKRTKR